MPPPQDEFRKGLSVAVRVGTELVATTLVGTFLGYLLDLKLDTDPWLMVAGLVVGAVAGLRNVYRTAQRWGN